MPGGLPPAALTALYVTRLDLIRRRAGALVAHAFTGLHLEELTAAQWDALTAGLYVAWVGTQLDAVTTVDSYIVATAIANGLPRPAAPIVANIYVGQSTSGALVLDVLTVTRRVVEARVAAGATPADALWASQSYLSAAIGSDPHRIARDATLDAAQGSDPRVVGWRRVAEGGACQFCRMLASRGAVYTSHATATLTAGAKKYHHHCRCYVEAVTNQVDRARTIKEGREQWRQMLADGDVPQAARSTPIPGGVTVTDVRRHQLLQLSQLESSLPRLAQRVAAGDTAAITPLAWQRGRVDELRALLAVAA